MNWPRRRSGSLRKGSSRKLGVVVAVMKLAEFTDWGIGAVMGPPAVRERDEAS